MYCSDPVQIEKLMYLCGTPRALTYNLLGSRTGWGLDWKKADAIIRNHLKPSDLGLPAKLWEWSVNDTMKAISAQQEAAKTDLIRAIYRKTSDQAERKRLSTLLKTNPTADNWLHRQFRQQYQRGHTYVRNQIVYQGAGYSCKRLTRNTVKLEVAGLEKGKRITLKLKCRHIINGQIRLKRNSDGQLEVHCIRVRHLQLPKLKPSVQIGIDKGYTEAFYTSNGQEIASGLGRLMTEKTQRITSKNRNRYRLRDYAQANPEKAANILKHNLGYRVKSRQLQREKATIQNIIRKDLRRVITSPTVIFAEDLAAPIKNKTESKAINRKLNQWMKGELQASLEKISRETGSTLSVVNPAYTSQMCSQTGTLLGQRNGDRFTCYTGVVIQADKNAAINILQRGSDHEITRYQKFADVRNILIGRTVRYLAELGKSVSEALELGWLNPKFKAEALRFEAEISPAGVAGTVKRQKGGSKSNLRSSLTTATITDETSNLDTSVQLRLDLPRFS